MTTEFMHDIGFRSVFYSSGMSDILGTAEDSESEGVEKFSLTENAVGGFEGKTRFTFQILAELSLLGNSLGHVELLFQLAERILEFIAHGDFVNFSKSFIDSLPQLCFVFRIRYIRNGIPDFVTFRNISDKISPSPIF